MHILLLVEDEQIPGRPCRGSSATACSTARQHMRTAATARGDALQLDGLAALPDLLRDVLDLDERVRLDDAQQVLLEQRVVQRGQMCADSRVGGEL